ncbi:N-acetylmuramoyl-L-alanine amidase [Ornithinibacillus sp. 179-J 7C1 HS]|uniref:N-acetylmuramoyl-L-alanine amidase n=1 Tax=Ornithinibacillus sp. 179-J 7C1 HS TaxID=3142384 RepID=UPI00399F9B2E
MKYSKCLILFSTFLFLFFFSFSLQAHAEIYEVEVDWLNMRSEPTTTASIVGRLSHGNKVSIFQKRNGWVQTYYNGEKVWVAARHLAPAHEEKVFLAEGLLSGYTIVIDPGHGGKDPGAIGHNGVLEKNLILETSLKIAKALEDNGAKVILTRADDSFVTLSDRVFISNQNSTDAFISIHFNAFDADYVGGINTYYHMNGKRLANEIQMALSKEVPLKNRGVIQHDYRVLRDNKYPAVLLELGFITNTAELATLQTDDYKDKVARAISIALISYFWNQR